MMDDTNVVMVLGQCVGKGTGIVLTAIIDKEFSRDLLNARRERAIARFELTPEERHAVSGMANLVFRMLDQGMSDADVCNELGMEPEELLRLKHITGFSKLFADRQYRRAWMARSQVEERRRYQEQQEAAAAAPTAQ